MRHARKFWAYATKSENLAVLTTILVCGALAACGTTPAPLPIDKPIVVTVDKPVPVSCVPSNFPTLPPAFPDTQAARDAAADFSADYNLLAAGYPIHQAWEQSLWDVVQGCLLAKPPDPG